MSMPDSKDALELFPLVIPSACKMLDIGAGEAQVAANIFREHGHNVDTVDFDEGATYMGDFNSVDIDTTYDAIWCSHCLEHQLNVHNFLVKIYDILNEDGWLAITVPPLKHTIVSGHVTLWNAGLVLYNLVVAGFDCSYAKIKTYGYNISIIVQKRSFEMPALTYNSGDLIRLENRFPAAIERKKKNGSFNGEIEELNWDVTKLNV